MPLMNAIIRTEENMNNITWKYVKPLADEKSIEDFEALVKVELPKDLKEIILSANGGRPSLRYYDLVTEKDKEFKSLLSFNRNDIENVFAFYPLDSAIENLVPFATDPAGNMFVLNDGKIHLWLHEADKTIYLADSFTGFLGLLHE